MNFEHTEDRRMLADTLNRFVAEQYGIEKRNHIAYGDTGTDPALWAHFAELGAIGALFPEADGGFGGAGFDVAVVFEALGSGLVVEPFVGALVVGRALGLAGSAAQKEHITGIIDGNTVAALAHEEPGAHYALNRVTTRAVRSGDGWLLTRHKAVGLHGDQAQKGRALPHWSTRWAGACWPCVPRRWARWKSPRKIRWNICRPASNLAYPSAAFRPCSTAWPTCCSKWSRRALPLSMRRLRWTAPTAPSASVRCPPPRARWAALERWWLRKAYSCTAALA